QSAVLRADSVGSAAHNITFAVQSHHSSASVHARAPRRFALLTLQIHDLKAFSTSEQGGRLGPDLHRPNSWARAEELRRAHDLKRQRRPYPRLAAASIVGRRYV